MSVGSVESFSTVVTALESEPPPCAEVRVYAAIDADASDAVLEHGARVCARASEWVVDALGMEPCDAPTLWVQRCHDAGGLGYVVHFAVCRVPLREPPQQRARVGFSVTLRDRNRTWTLKFLKYEAVSCTPRP